MIHKISMGKPRKILKPKRIPQRRTACGIFIEYLHPKTECARDIRFVTCPKCAANHKRIQKYIKAKAYR